MEQTDMLIVAGGDGTLQEVITGLLRRPDQVGVTESSGFDILIETCLLVKSLMDVLWLQDKVSNIPVGFIPLGSHNSLSPSLHLLSDNKVKYVSHQYLQIFVITQSHDKVCNGCASQL